MPKKLIIQEIRDGFITPVLEPEAYIFGAGQVVDEILEPTGQWVSNLPTFEIQQKLIETANCTAFGSTSQIEALEKRKFGTTPNYSDRYLGIRAGTRPPGNDPQKVYETIRAYGLAPEECLPFPDNFSLNDYYSFNGGSETDCDRHAKDWKKKYILKHEWLSRGESIPTSIILEALKRSPIAIAVFAWASDGTKYVRAGNDTHWCVIVGTYSNGDWMVLDSYAPFIKRLDKNFGFNWAKRIWLGKNELSQAEISIFQSIIDTIKKWVAELTKRVNEVAPVVPIDSVELPPTPPTPKYLWGTSAEARHSVRLICDEEGLKTFEKDLICAVIECESGFKTEAKNRNADGTLDLGKILKRRKLGIAQLNTYWYVDKMKLITREEALNNPEKSVRIMIKRYKQGFLKDWVCYKKGLYKKYMPKVGSRITKRK